MKKWILAMMLVLAAVLMIAPMTASADDIIKDGNLTYKIENGAASVTECDEAAMGSIIIPKAIRGYPVIAIDMYAFSDCKMINRVSVADSVRTISAYAFFGCSGLTNILIPSSVTEIGMCAFRDCTKLSSVSVPGSVKIVGANAFSDCSNLKTVAIANGVTTLKSGVFYECTSLEKIVLPNSITEMGSHIFYDCSNLKDVTLPSRIKQIPYHGFCYCTSLREIRIPNGVTEFETCAFYRCTNLQVIYIPESVTNFGYCAFTDDEALADVYYTGSQAQWKQIFIDQYNDPLKASGLRIHYNCAPWTNYVWSDSDSWNLVNTYHNFDDGTLNHQRGFENRANGYYITSQLYEALTSNLHPVDYCAIASGLQRNSVTNETAYLFHYNVDNERNEKLRFEWSGSCFGLSVWASLIKDGVLSVRDLGVSASSLHDVSNSRAIRSAVNYYQFQWELSAWQNACRDFCGKTQEEQIESIIQQALQAPTVVCFQWRDYSETPVKSGSHAVVAYGLETNGSWTKAVDGITKTFHSRILIYDCACPQAKEQEDYHIYFTDDYSYWCIPAYHIMAKTTKSDYDSAPTAVTYPKGDNGAIYVASNEIDLLNCISFTDGGSLSPKMMDAKLGSARLYTVSEAQFNVSTKDGGAKIEGLRFQKTGGWSTLKAGDLAIAMEPNVMPDGSKTASSIVVFVPEEPSYQIESKESLQFGFGDHDQVTYVSSAAGGSCDFYAYGGVSVHPESKTDITVRLINNQSSYSWDTVTVKVKNTSDLKVVPTKSGADISGSALKDTVVEVERNGKTFSAKVVGGKNVSIIYADGLISVRENSSTSSPFTDVPADQYYYDPVLWAVNRQPQITNGTSPTTFSPNATCTRGQVVTFLWRAKGCPEPKSAKNPFTDVPSSQYYYKAVLWANEQGITNGTSATTFSPDAPCTRAHVVTFLWRAESKPAAGRQNPFTDVPAGQYFTDAVLWAVSKNITNGTSPTTFSPDSPCTRGQIVTFLYRDMK